MAGKYPNGGKIRLNFAAPSPGGIESRETAAVHFSNSGNTDVDSITISEHQDVLQVRLNRKIVI